MANIKLTKRALLSSVMALILCFTMLLGTTFAWFTDTASTNVNKIEAGTLDVALEMYENNEWVSAEGKTLKFTDNKWEPGCTYALPALRVVNKGNLALKYKVIITGINGNAKLNEVIEWTIGDVALGAEQHLAAGASAEFTISGHMKESAGNEYMNLEISGISITVYATQDTVEHDSNGDQYDANAAYDIPWDGSDADNTNVPAASQDGKIHISTAAELVSVMNTSQNSNSAHSGKIFVLDNNINLGGQTVKGFGSDQCNFAGSFDGQGYTISNFVIDATNREYYAGLFNQIGPGNGYIANLTVKNAIITGQNLVGAISSNLNDSYSIKNCKVYNCTLIGADQVGAVVGGIFETCFVTGCYAQDCTVIYNVGTYQDTTNYVIGYKGERTTDHGNSYSRVDIIKSLAALVSTADDLVNAASTGYAVMADDITANAKQTTASGYGNIGVSAVNVNGTVLDGGGNTLTVTNANTKWDSGIMTNGGTIKNVTVKGSFRGILTGGLSSDLYVDNVVLDDVTYTFSADGSGNYDVVFTNSTLNGWTSFTGGFKSVSFTDCKFGESRGYSYCRPYSDTIFTNCVFAAGYEFDATRATSTFVNCYVGSTLITADNIVTLLGADAVNVVVNNH